MKVFLSVLSVLVLVAALYFAHYAVHVACGDAAAARVGEYQIFGSMICLVCAGVCALIFNQLLKRLTFDDGDEPFHKPSLEKAAPL